MSWAGLASNQIVSDTNLADAVTTGVFAAKTAIPSTGRELTRTAAEAYAYINSVTSKATNQLVTKSNLTASIVGPGPYNVYIYGVSADKIYKSSNGGFTFTTLGISTGLNLTAIAANQSGQYVIAGSRTTDNAIYVSNNYGASFFTVNVSNVGSPYTFGSFYICDIDISYNGQYIAVMGKTTSGSSNGYITVAMSSNYGVSFTAYYSSYFNGLGVRTSVSVSGDGSHITYVAYGSDLTRSWRYSSINYGVSFPTSALSTNQYFTDVSLSSTGTYQMILNTGTAGSGNIFISTNGGGVFSSRATFAGGFYYCGMTDTGQGMVVATNNGNTYYSTDYGQNWASTLTNVGAAFGMSVSTSVVTTPYVVPYVAEFQTNTLQYANAVSTNTMYAQPLSITLDMNKVYRRGYNY